MLPGPGRPQIHPCDRPAGVEGFQVEPDPDILPEPVSQLHTVQRERHRRGKGQDVPGGPLPDRTQTARLRDRPRDGDRQVAGVRVEFDHPVTPMLTRAAGTSAPGPSGGPHIPPALLGQASGIQVQPGTQPTSPTRSQPARSQPVGLIHQSLLHRHQTCGENLFTLLLGMPDPPGRVAVPAGPAPRCDPQPCRHVRGDDGVSTHIPGRNRDPFTKRRQCRPQVGPFSFQVLPARG
jgi:hypothetical protein